MLTGLGKIAEKVRHTRRVSVDEFLRFRLLMRQREQTVFVAHRNNIRRRPEMVVGLLISLLGIFAYFLVSDPLGQIQQNRLFGYEVYDYYLRSLSEGRWDVPLRIVSVEGHYAPNGDAYVYHGLAPLVPRAIMAAFVDLNTIHSNRWVIFICCSTASAIFQFTIYRVIQHSGRLTAVGYNWLVLTGIMCWSATGVPIAVSNSSMYNETFATAVLAIAIAGHVFSRIIVFQDPIAKWLILLAFAFVILLHSRTIIALGLGLSIGALWLICLWETRQRHLSQLVISALIIVLGFSILAYSNQARFGSVTQMHGTMDATETDQIQHAVAYWGIWERRGVNFADTFIKHGSFNAGRIPGNALMQITGNPVTSLAQLAVFEQMQSRYGLPRHWGPYAGVLFLWTPWIVIIFLAVLWRHPARGLVHTGRLAIAAAGGLATCFLTLSYASLHFRYRVDLWPLISILSISALAVLLHRDQPVSRINNAFRVTVLATVSATIISIDSAVQHSTFFLNRDNVGALFGKWSEPLCLELVTEKGFPPEQHAGLCDLF